MFGLLLAAVLVAKKVRGAILIGIVATTVLAIIEALARVGPLSDFFHTMGTVFGLANEGEILNDDGSVPHLQGILVVDSLGAIAGGLAGTSSNTSFIESASGVGDGARTGVASAAVPRYRAAWLSHYGSCPMAQTGEGALTRA